MITLSLRGQTANQCFQIATTYAHSLRMNTTFAVPERSGKRNQLPMMFPHLPKMQQWNGEIFDSVPYREKRFGIYEPLPNDENLHLMGYWQSFKYFEDYRDEVIELFEFPKISLNQYKNSLFEGRTIVSVHVRRGDSLKFINKLPQPTDNYFHQAFEIFGKDCTFVVFSDDIEYCIQYFKKFDQYTFKYEMDSCPKGNISLMASCDHNIIVNSTFSLWASWMNENKNKVVVSPHKESWFGKDYWNRLSAQDMIPDKYIQIRY